MGSGNSAANAATAANGQSQQQINSTVSAIQNAYGSPARQQQYQQYGNSLNNYYTNQVNTQQGVNARDLTFALARSGLTGGSAATDANGQLQKDYTNGLLQANQQAQSGEAALENSDVNAKNQLIGLAEEGDTTGNIGSDIASAQNSALGAAGAYGQANALGNLFSGTSAIYNQEQNAAANRKAQGSPIGSLYGGTTNSSSAFT